MQIARTLRRRAPRAIDYRRRMIRTTLSILVVVVCAVGCSKKSSDGSKAAPAGNYLTVATYCSTFCDKLCGTCGQGDCKASCSTRCHFGREDDYVLDGKDPKKGLALTQKELDACIATITAESCPKIGAGQVPVACYTIQH